MKNPIFTILFMMFLPAWGWGQKLPDLPALSAPATGDLIYGVDVSDTTDHATGSSKKLSIGDLSTFLHGQTMVLSNKTISGSNNTLSNIPWAGLTGLPAAITGLGGWGYTGGGTDLLESPTDSGGNVKIKGRHGAYVQVDDGSGGHSAAITAGGLIIAGGGPYLSIQSDAIYTHAEGVYYIMIPQGVAGTMALTSDIPVSGSGGYQPYHSTLAAIAAGTWTGAGSITTLGTVSTGTWQGTAIADAYIASAAAWNAKQNAIGLAANQLYARGSSGPAEGKPLEPAALYSMGVYGWIMENPEEDIALLTLGSDSMYGRLRFRQVANEFTTTFYHSETLTENHGVGIPNKSGTLAFTSDIPASGSGGYLPYSSTTTFSRGLLDDSDVSTARETLGIGSMGTQTWSGSAGFVTFDGDQFASTMTLDVTDITGISSFAQTLLDDSNAGAARTTLGLGAVYEDWFTGRLRRQGGGEPSSVSTLGLAEPSGDGNVLAYEVRGGFGTGDSEPVPRIVPSIGVGWEGSEEADWIWFWDSSEADWRRLYLGSGLSISGTTLSATGGGSGTVTSVGLSAPTGLSVTGSPVTTSGTLTLAWTAGYQGYTSAEATKLSGIETGADVTDAANVAAAGAVMESETSTASMSFVVDEDDMSSDSATKVPTQQSVRAFVTNNSFGSLPYVCLQYQEPANTTGASFSAGSWQTGPVNTEVVDTHNICSIASNQITLPAGTYWIEHRSVGQSGSWQRMRLRNVTDSTTLLTGISGNITQHELNGRFTLSGTKALERQLFSSGSGNWGGPTNNGTEIYAEIHIWKIAP